MNHKRGRPKNRRAGCLMCKNWKMNGAGKNSKEYERPADRRRRLGCEQDLRETFDTKMSVGPFLPSPFHCDSVGTSRSTVNAT